MSSLSRNQIIGLVGFFIILISIPISFYLVKQTQIFRSRASEPKTSTPTGPVTKAIPSPSLTDLQRLMQATAESSTSSSSPTPTPEVNLAFGPTLNLTISIEGRPAGKQADKVFVGLAAGSAQVNPTYILTFSIDVPDSGIFKGLSLAGLNPGSTYTAYVKGSSTIVSSSTFTMTPTETNLNDSKPLNLISGDLNEDNVINSADYSICLSLYGTTPKSSNWNPRADFNKDNIINNFDLVIISKNMSKTGTSGPWISTPTVSTPSAELINKPNVGGLASPNIGGLASPNLGGPPADFGSILSASTSSASPSPTSNSTGYWIRVP